jgi:hypothetical protein
MLFFRKAEPETLQLLTLFLNDLAQSLNTKSVYKTLTE